MQKIKNTSAKPLLSDPLNPVTGSPNRASYSHGSFCLCYCLCSFVFSPLFKISCISSSFESKYIIFASFSVKFTIRSSCRYKFIFTSFNISDLILQMYCLIFSCASLFTVFCFFFFAVLNT